MAILFWGIARALDSIRTLVEICWWGEASDLGVPFRDFGGEKALASQH